MKKPPVWKSAPVWNGPTETNGTTGTHWEEGNFLTSVPSPELSSKMRKIMNDRFEEKIKEALFGEKEIEKPSIEERYKHDKRAGIFS